jgi:hypothetical protein
LWAAASWLPTPSTHTTHLGTATACSPRTGASTNLPRMTLDLPRQGGHQAEHLLETTNQARENCFSTNSISPRVTHRDYPARSKQEQQQLLTHLPSFIGDLSPPSSTTAWAVWDHKTEWSPWRRRVLTLESKSQPSVLQTFWWSEETYWALWKLCL